MSLHTLSLPKNKSERYELINNVYNGCNNYAQTAKTLDVTVNTVKAAHQWVIDNRPTCPKMGRPIKVTAEIRYYIAIFTIFYPSISSEILSDHIKSLFGVQLGESTIDFQRHKLGFKFGPRLSTLNLDAKSKLNRLNFSRWIIANHICHRNIIFTDESWFFMGPNNYYVWRKIGRIYNTVTKEHNLHPDKVMFWGGIGFNYKTPLMFFTESVTSKSYIDVAIKGSNLKATADMRFGKNHWMLQQDNARPHTAISTQNELRNLGINLLTYWPPYSPDLSPIEIIWAIMKRRVDKFKPQNLEQLVSIVQFVWDNISYHTINALIDSFPQRILKCMQSQGNEVRFHI